MYTTNVQYIVTYYNACMYCIMYSVYNHGAIYCSYNVYMHCIMYTTMVQYIVNTMQACTV